METLIENRIRDFIMVISGEDSEVAVISPAHRPVFASEYVGAAGSGLGMANALSPASCLFLLFSFFFIRDTFILRPAINLVPREHVPKLWRPTKTQQLTPR